MPSIGEKIRDARLQRGLTQIDLAEDLVTPSMISQIEADKTKPSYPLLTAIANRLGLPVEHFLNDLQDQFTLAAHLRLAEYYLCLKRPELAEAALHAVDPPAPPGLDYQDYHLYLSRAYRMLGRAYDAMVLLEDLREQAIRHQNKRLLFSVRKESGYVESDMGNLEGAMMEWEKALQIGEMLRDSGEWNSVQAGRELSEICMALYETSLDQKDTAYASHMASRAAELTKDFTRVRDIAAQLVNDGKQSLEAGESAKAKPTLDLAVTALQLAQLVEHAIARNAIADKLSDPWSQIAAATASANPHAYIEAELHHITRHINEGRTALAFDGIQRCNAFLDLCEQEIEGFSGWNTGLRQKVQTEAARAYISDGNPGEGMRVMHDVVECLTREGHLSSAVQATASWLQMAAELGDTKTVLDLSDKLQTLVLQANNRT